MGEPVARIMVVDDNEMNIRVLEALLSGRGYTVSTAHDGEEALEKIQEEIPDLMLLDAMMPRVDGFAVLKKLKENPKTRLIPVVMLTALSDLDSNVKAVELGADDFLTKPFNKALLLARVRSLLHVKFLLDELESVDEIIAMTARIVEAKDEYTEGHVERVTAFALGLGQAAGLNEWSMRNLRRGALLHDLGKIAVPDDVLNKPGKLDKEEWDHILRHPEVGASILKGLKSLASVVDIVLHHHEKLDGSGYPDGLKGDEITIESRIMAIADIYDALTTKRSYKEGMSKETALRILQEEGQEGKLDERLVNIFSQLVERGEFESLGDRIPNLFNIPPPPPR
ncbi:response regulator [bacterium]|nr:response regulator [bacterium]